MKLLDWDAVEAKARRMSEAELAAAIRDCLAVLPNVRAIELAGWLPSEAKSEGYYCDEISVYRRELRNRAQGKCSPVTKLTAVGNKMAEVLLRHNLGHEAVSTWDEAVLAVEMGPVEVA